MFELSKWYLDCVSEDGDVFIGYCARLRSGKLSLCYESALECPAHGAADVSHSLRASLPSARDGCVSWNSTGLGIAGEWRRDGAELRETVFRSDRGSVEWHAVLPKGGAMLRTRTGTFRGFGYVEHLRMTVPPWRIPIRTLRWGRLLTPGNALVWIDWEGGHGATIVYLNGARINAESIGDDGIALEGGITAAFDRGLVLRSGALGSTVLAGIPGIGKIAPARIFAVDECKWRSRATLERPGEAAEQGWCIHEVVRWP